MADLGPAAEWVAVSALKAWDRNPRHNADAIPKVEASIRRFGFAAPIVARRDGTIIAGHTRWEAAKRLCLEVVPVRFLDLDDTEAMALALADNKLSEIAGWDADALRELSREVDLTEIGWGELEVADLWGELPPVLGDAPEDDTVPRHAILVECRSEHEQAMWLERLAAEGVSCRAVM
jgi:ParB-like chromosome segregation protein Spo0J